MFINFVEYNIKFKPILYHFNKHDETMKLFFQNRQMKQ